MGEMMVIRLVFGVLLAAGAAVLMILAFLLFYQYLVLEKKCTARTLGVVERYTFIRIGKDGSGIFLPVVAYEVDGREYEVVGPEYRGFRTATVESPALGNGIGFYETKGHELVIEWTANSLVKFRKNPIAELHPEGTQLPVFFDPAEPTLVYVLRYCGNKNWMFWLTFGCGIGMAVLDFFIQLIL